ncbi:creatininase family protein [Egibacter rhizosphaerae]|uniref:Creatininase family protein n=1 Tax=Egibacter rhizosphaerae TaxID=1670831 RepID=A0A411YI51_9ACTN|nr:creatininase family protein [Egibacter rhizosphaerae]QBI20809.1 creatininase family protein [Egibacter rhizosphaerae]
MTHDLGTITSPELAGAFDGPRLALIPVGATEQHGPNLGMAVDYRIAQELAHLVAGRMDGRAYVAPPLPFGLSAHHMAFPGTITIGAEAFQAVLLDVVDSLAAHGFGHFLFINGHMGNQNVLGVLTTRIHFERGLRAASSLYFAQAKDAVERHRRTFRYGHACEVETSVAMYLTPELVNEGALEPGDLIEDYIPHEDNYLPHPMQVPKSFAERTRNGVFGDATQASREAGQDIVETAVERMVAFAAAFLEQRSDAIAPSHGG